MTSFQQDYFLDSGTLLTGIIQNLNQIKPESETICLWNCRWKGNNEYEGQYVEKKVSLIILGDGDYSLNDDIVVFIQCLKNKGVTIQNLALANLEIESKQLDSLFGVVRESLESLEVLCVPFEKAHFQVLNESNLHLKHLSLKECVADQENPFANSQIKKETEVIDLNLKNLDKLRYLGLSSNLMTEKIFNNVVKSAKKLEYLKIENTNDDANLNCEYIINGLCMLTQLKTLSLRGNNLRNIANFQEGTFPPNLLQVNLIKTQIRPETIADLKSKFCPPQYPADFFVFDIDFNVCINKDLGIFISHDLSKNRKRYEKALKELKDSKDDFLGSLWKSDELEKHFPIMLKMLSEIKSFNKACKSDLIDLIKEPQLFFPKNNIELAELFEKVTDLNSDEKGLIFF